MKELREKWFTKRELSLLQENSAGGGDKATTAQLTSTTNILLSPSPLIAKTSKLADIKQIKPEVKQDENTQSENSSMMANDSSAVGQGYNVTRVKYQVKNAAAIAGEEAKEAGLGASVVP